jgi:hypothetical protein
MGKRHRTVGSPASNRWITRRAATLGIVGGSGALALLSGHGPHIARAEATPEADVSTGEAGGAHRYALSGSDVEIVYEPAAAGEEARLTYRDADTSRQFTGDEIDVTESLPLGLMVSVFLDAAPDAYTEYLALLIPQVNRVEPQSDVPLQTVAILARHLTSIGGPRLVEGALQTYEVIAFEGVAEFAPE